MRSVGVRIGSGEVKVGHGDKLQRVRGRLRGDGGVGLEFDFGDADAIFHEENFFGTAVQDVEAAVVLGMSGVPVGGRLAEFGVLQEFHIDDAEGLIGKIAGEVGESAGEESSLSVLQFDGDGIFAFNRVLYLGVPERDVDVVVAMPVHQSLGMRRDVGDEDADLGVGKDLEVVRLGGDFDFWSGLGGQESGQEQEERERLHRGDCSIGRRVRIRSTNPRRRREEAGSSLREG